MYTRTEGLAIRTVSEGRTRNKYSLCSVEQRSFAADCAPVDGDCGGGGVDICVQMWVGPNSTVCWWNENVEFCCHRTMFTETSLVSSNSNSIHVLITSQTQAETQETAQIFLLHNYWGQNKCTQLLIALKPLFVFNVLHNSMNDIWLLLMSCWMQTQ